MQFRICKSQLALESIDKSLIFLAKLEKCILPSFQEFLIWGIPRFGNSRNEGSLISGILSQRAQRHETNRFFGGIIQFLVPFFASRQSLCTWHGYFEKISVLACFFWSLGALLQSSATPQGSPPPTQQIKIQMQIGWVGRSTRLLYEHRYSVIIIKIKILKI